MQTECLLGEPRQRTDARAVGEHGAHTDHLGAHRAEADNPRSAGVGGDGSTDGGRVATGEIHRRIETRRPGVGTPLRQRHPGSGGDLHCAGIDGFEVGEAARRHDDHRLASRHASPDESRVAALGHERRAGLGAPAHDVAHLRIVTWSDDESSLAAVAPGPVDGVRGRDVGIRKNVLGPDDLGERSGQRVAHPTGRSNRVCSALPTAPSSSNSRASLRPTPVGCQCEVTRLPIHSPTGSRCSATTRSVLRNRI